MNKVKTDNPLIRILTHCHREPFHRLIWNSQSTLLLFCLGETQEDFMIIHNRQRRLCEDSQLDSRFCEDCEREIPGKTISDYGKRFSRLLPFHPIGPGENFIKNGTGIVFVVKVPTLVLF